MESNEDNGFGALILIEASLAASYNLVFSDLFGYFLKSLSDRACMKSSRLHSCSAHRSAIRSQKSGWRRSVVLR